MFPIRNNRRVSSSQRSSTGSPGTPSTGSPGTRRIRSRSRSSSNSRTRTKTRSRSRSRSRSQPPIPRNKEERLGIITARDDKVLSLYQPLVPEERRTDSAAAAAALMARPVPPPAPPAQQGYEVPVVDAAAAARPINVTDGQRQNMIDNIHHNFSKLKEGMQRSVETFNNTVSPYTESFIQIFNEARSGAGRIARLFSKTVNTVKNKLKERRIRDDIESYNAFTSAQLKDFEKLEDDLVGLDMTDPYDSITRFVQDQGHRNALKRLFVYEYHRLGKPKYLNTDMGVGNIPQMYYSNYKVLVYLLIYYPDYDLTYTPFGTNISEHDARTIIETGNANALIATLENADQRAITLQGAPEGEWNAVQQRPTGVFNISRKDTDKIKRKIKRAEKSVIIRICETMIHNAVVNGMEPGRIESAREELNDFNEIDGVYSAEVTGEHNLYVVEHVANGLGFSIGGIGGVYDLVVNGRSS